MPDADLSSIVPPDAAWVKLHFEMFPKSPGARLIARVGSDSIPDKFTVIRGNSGDVFIKLGPNRKISYQFPVNIELKLKVTAYKKIQSRD